METRWIKVLKVGSFINFMDKRNIELEGVVFEVEVRLEKGRDCIIYGVTYEGEHIIVDGETFRKI